MPSSPAWTPRRRQAGFRTDARWWRPSCRHQTSQGGAHQRTCTPSTADEPLPSRPLGNTWRDGPRGALSSRHPSRRPQQGDPGPYVDDLEIATAEYIDWFNHRRLHSETAPFSVRTCPGKSGRRWLSAPHARPSLRLPNASITSANAHPGTHRHRSARPWLDLESSDEDRRVEGAWCGPRGLSSGAVLRSG